VIETAGGRGGEQEIVVEKRGHGRGEADGGKEKQKRRGRPTAQATRCAAM
jgi:hypothetical protein